MKLGQKLLLFYSAAISVFITFGAVIDSIETGNWFLAGLTSFLLLHFALKILSPGRRFSFLLYYSFILTTIMTLTGFIGARSGPQLISALLFLPLALYFWQLILPKRSRQIPVTDLGFEIITVDPEPVTHLKKILPADRQGLQQEKPGRRLDIDRRAFLKLIGSAGLTLFMFSIFTKRAEAAFFGSVPGPGTVALKDTTGTQVDPAIKHPTDGYKISEIDDSSPAYYGFIEKTGKWFIMKESSSGTYRYVKGDSGFSTNWTNRASLSYDYYDVVF